MELIMSIDFVIWLLVGAVLGVVSGQFMKGGGYGIVGNVAIGVIGSVISGFAFDIVDFMDFGDLADPIIAGVVGATILLAAAALLRRQESNSSATSTEKDQE